MPQMPTSRALPAGEAELSPTLTYHLIPSVVGQQHRLGRFHYRLAADSPPSPVAFAPENKGSY